MLPRFWVVSTKPEAELALGRLVSLVEREGGVWRRVMAGQK
jgi:hypothetical protein